MSETLSDLANRFRFNGMMLRGLTNGLTEEHWAQAGSDIGGNTAHWILGHLAGARRTMLRVLGTEIETEPWEGMFGRGSTPGEIASYPVPSELYSDFLASGKRLGALLSEMGPVRQAVPWEGEPFPDGSNTLGGAAHFFHFHESYHLGQMGILRRMCGLERLV